MGHVTSSRGCKPDLKPGLCFYQHWDQVCTNSIDYQHKTLQTMWLNLTTHLNSICVVFSQEIRLFIGKSHFKVPQLLFINSNLKWELFVVLTSAKRSHCVTFRQLLSGANWSGGNESKKPSYRGFYERCCLKIMYFPKSKNSVKDCIHSKQNNPCCRNTRDTLLV